MGGARGAVRGGVRGEWRGGVRGKGDEVGVSSPDRGPVGFSQSLPWRTSQ